MRYFFTFILLLTATVIVAQETTGSVAGTITDKDMNNEPLPFANVQIKGTTKGTTTDVTGLYEINGLDPGTYTVVISFIGYETLEVPNVTVQSGKITDISTGLGSNSVALEGVVVTTSARRDSERALLLDQKKAIAIKTSIGGEEFSKKGISDASAAVSKIAGISQVSGSGSVYVRGLGDRYLNTTMNGLSLPSNDINNKNIDLDLFSSDIIQSVAVSKAYASNFYGDFSAGNLDITSKEYTGKGFFEVTMGAGLNANAVGEDFLKNEGTGYFGFYNRYDHDPFSIILSNGVDPKPHSGIDPVNAEGAIAFGKSFQLFGEDSESMLSLFGTASFDSGFKFYEGTEANYGSNLDVLFPNVDRYIYETTSTAMLGVIYKINNDHKIKFNSLAINSSNDEVGYYGTMGQGFSQDLNSDVGYFQLNSQFNQDLIFVNQLVGKHVFSEKWNLDWGVGYNKVYANEPDRKRITLNNYNFLFDDDASSFPNFGQQNNFNNQRYFQEIEDQELNSRIALAYQAAENLNVHIGYNGRTKKRNFENQRYGYKNISQDFIVRDPNQLNAIFNIDNFFLGSEDNGSGYQTHVFRPIAPEIGLTQTNSPGLPENTYTGKLDVHAGYLSAEWNITEDLLFVPGIRVESVKQHISYDVINLRPDVSPGENGVSEAIYLPSLNFKYSIAESQNLRFSGSQTVSFPEFKEMAPFVYEGVTERVGGNPDLLGHRVGTVYNNVEDVSYSKILNFDLKYEWFFGRSEVLSVAGFTKTIHDPVNLVVANDATGTRRYFRTGEKATVFGVEVEAKKNLLKNEDTILSFGFNASYMYTEQDLYDQLGGTFSTSFDRNKDQLQGASPLILNADLSYSPVLSENYKPILNVIFNYYDDRIYALGSGQLGNIMEKGFPTLDFIVKNKIANNWEVNLKAKNVLDPTFELTREITDKQEVILQDFKKGAEFGIQLKYKF